MSSAICGWLLSRDEQVLVDDFAQLCGQPATHQAMVLPMGRPVALCILHARLVWELKRRGNRERWHPATAELLDALGPLRRL